MNIKKNLTILLVALLAASLGFNLYLFTKTSSLSASLTSLGEEISALSSQKEDSANQLKSAVTELTTTQAALDTLKKEQEQEKKQQDFEEEFGEELSFLATDTTLTIEERKNLLEEIGVAFEVNVDKYLEMITDTPWGSNPERSAGGQAGVVQGETPGSVPNPNAGGTDTAGMTREEMDGLDTSGFQGEYASGSGGSTSHPNDRLY